MTPFQSYSTTYTGSNSLDAPGAANPHGRAYQVMTSGGLTSKPDHWSPGETFQAGLAVIDMKTSKAVPIDGYKQVALFRLQDGGTAAGYGEFLAADGTWQPLTDTATVAFHDVSETRPGSSVYIRNFTDTASWGTYDIFVLGRCKVGFFEFNNYVSEIGVGGVNKHSGYAFDGPGWLGFPTR